MNAAVVRRLPTDHLEVAEVAEPSARADEVVVEVEACGICGTDIHILAGGSYRPELPFVLGHEPVGTVVAGGQDRLGKRVTVTLFEGCGACRFCRDQDERLCPDLRSIVGVDRRWGAFAERFAVPARQLVEVPDGLDAGVAAAVVDAGATAANVARTATATGAGRVFVLGAGPVGELVARLLLLTDRAVEIVERSDARRMRLQQDGLSVVGTLAEIEGPPDGVVECTGSPDVIASALDRLRPHGVLVLAGYSVVPELDLAPVARKELAVRGVRSGSRADLADVLGLAAKGELEAPPVTTWSLDRINDAFDALRSGQVVGKAVINPRLDNA
jgi:propanol-preferring alcohol dehydrogenase